MLQFLISDKNLRYTPLQQVEIAIEGGCQWVHIPSTLKLDELEVIEKKCREAGVFLTIDDDEELTDRRRFHGVLLNTGHAKSAAEVRSGLGPHAVVGVEVDDASVLPGLMKDDIDYAVYDIDSHGIERAIVFASDSGKRHIPLVARGKMLDDGQILKLMEAGFNGVLTAGVVLESSLPTEKVKSVIEELHAKF